jgi:hypothetical protein
MQPCACSFEGTTGSSRALYETKIVEIYDQAFASGAIDRQIEEYAAVVRAAATERSSLVDLERYDQGGWPG